MSDQLSLFGKAEAAAVYSLFLAILPDSRTAEGLHELGGWLRGKHGLTGALRPMNHLHVSLHGLGEHPEVREDLVKAGSAACEEIAAQAAAFEVVFDRVQSFPNNKDRKPFVLRGGEGSNPELIELYRNLDTALARRVPRRKWGGGFLPHLTLMWDGKVIGEEEVEPVRWIVREITLVCSEVGATKYSLMGRWVLGDEKSA